MLDLENSRVMEEIEELSQRKRWHDIRDMLLPFEPADIAAILAEMQSDRLPLLYRLLPKELAAEVFVELDSDDQELLIHSFSNTELKEVLQKICMEESRKRQTKSFLVGKSSAYEKVCLDDIFYIERNGKDAVFCCSGAQYVERKPLKTVFSELPETEFAYINSGQIVNLMRIAEFNKDEVKLDSGAVLHCSRRMKKDFEAKMLAFWERL